ncbi:MAG TPA: response regulator [Alcanivoracaceae bacterium]|nr:response regulator [Alcanivoracaceae bacterium]
MTQLLIIEDEPKIARLLQDYLTHSGFSSHWCATGQAGLDWLAENNAQIVLLDLMLPDMDGLEVCKQLRRTSDIAIIMITARVDEVDRLLGLELGADDYICKPFSPREVVARVKALQRRLQPETQHHQGFHFDDNRLSFHYQGQEVAFTMVEFALLRSLAERPGHIRNRQQLMDHIYDDNRIVSDRTVDSHIKKVRRKLAEVFPHTQFIHSIYGVGYRFDIEKEQ